MRAKLVRPFGRFALVATALFAVAGGVAYAVIPDSGTSVYHACMLKGVGTIG